MQLSGGNKSAAAQFLGVGRKVVERRLKSREARGQETELLLENARQRIEVAKFREAITLLRRCLGKLGRRNDARALRFEVYRLLGIALRSVNGWLCAEACACHEAALQAGEGLNRDAELVSMQFGIWVAQLMTLELGRARATAQDMLQRARDIGSQAALDEAQVAMANTLFWLGDYEEALACLARGGLLQGGEGEARKGLQGFDLSALALTFEGLAAFQLGAFAQARQAMQRLPLRCGEDNPHPFNRALALQGAVWLACLFEDRERLGPLAADLEALSEAHGFTFYRGLGQVFRGCHMGALGAVDEAERFMLEGYQNHMLNHGGRLFHSFQAWQRGELLLQAGRPAECESLLAEALELALERQERAYLGELLTSRRAPAGRRATRRVPSRNCAVPCPPPWRWARCRRASPPPPSSPDSCARAGARSRPPSSSAGRYAASRRSRYSARCWPGRYSCLRSSKTAADHVLPKTMHYKE
ncbi:helix-turn-helix domain-containing protein [Azotobacter sp. CWF10]